MVAHNLTNAVYKHHHYVQNHASVGIVSLSVFGGNFVSAKVHRGLISVLFRVERCQPLGGSKSMVKSIRGKFRVVLFLKGLDVVGGFLYTQCVIHSITQS